LNCEEFWARREKDVIEAKIEAMQQGGIILCKHSEAVINYLSSRYYLAVVSDSQQECVDFALSHFNLKQYFKIWYGRKSDLESLANRKPNPYYINKILNELNMRRDEAILVDDSPVGILAAEREGIDSVLIGRNKATNGCEPTFLVNNIGELRQVL
jgi:phosphoglycolate phosphatase-like HAD superfamily hydrolase